MKVIATIVILGIVVVIASLFFIYLGIYNVSAIEPDARLIQWVMSTTMDNSVRRHAAGISVPPLTDPDMVRKGAGYYQTTCSICHGAPGVARAPLAKGLNPPAPSLGEAVSDWTPAELYWIVKHGIRMTGMPAFAPSYNEDQLWAVVAFLQRLPALSPTDYRALVESVGIQPHSGANHELREIHNMSFVERRSSLVFFRTIFRRRTKNSFRNNGLSDT